jgi:cellobiose-specific phosphotransferase system component IIB
MAENTTTYKAVIDVETKGSDSLTKLNKELDSTIEGFVDFEETISKTRKALQKAKLDGDKVEFKRLRKELNKVEKQFEDTEIQSRRFSDALSEQPGIVGLVGGSLKGLDGGLKVLAANPIIAVVTLLAGLFLAFKESLSKTERGQELLNKASEAFGKVLGPIFAIIEKVAFPIFEFFIELIDQAAAAFNRFAKFLGIGTKEIEEASRASSEVLQKKYEEQQKAEEEATKKLEEEKNKQIEIEKKAAEERKRIQEEADTILLEAQLSAMDDRDREIKERELRYQEELKKLKLAGVTDLTLFELEYRQDLLDINKTYDDAELQREKDQQAKVEAEKQKAHDLEKQRLADIASLESQARADKIDRLISEFEFNNTIKAQSFQAELDLFDQTRDLERQELVAQGISADALVAFDKQTATARIQIERAMQETKLTIISDALGTIAEAVGKETAAGKALAISQALINTYLGATKALATYPPPFGAIAAGTVIAAGLLQVNAIRKQKLPDVPKPGGGTISNSGGGGGGGATTPTTSFSAPQVNFLPQGDNTGTQISETIANSRQSPVRAYVVSNDISSQQALDRRITNASTL